MARMRYGSGKVFVIRHQDFILASIKEGKTLAMIHEEIVASTKESISYHALVYHINHTLLGKNRFGNKVDNKPLLLNKTTAIDRKSILAAKEDKSIFEASLNAREDDFDLIGYSLSNIVCIPLHHFVAFVQIFGAVIGRPYRIAACMG